MINFYGGNRLVQTVLLSFLACGAPALIAQPVGKLPAGTTIHALTGTAVYQFDAKIDAGGDIGLTRLGVGYDLMRSLGNDRAIGLGIDYDADLFSFSGEDGLGALEPWGTVNTLSLAVGYTGKLGEDWSFRVAPSISASGESSASFSDSLRYGAVFAFTREFSKTLTLGLGAGVFSGLEETRAFPFIAVRWAFAPGWTLQNPFRPGPAGPAGLEVAYKTDTWEFGFGGSYRSFRFRLADDGYVANGIGEYNTVPLFARASRPIGRYLTLDAYAGMVVGGSIELADSAGNDLTKSDFDTAPLIALSISGRF